MVSEDRQQKETPGMNRFYRAYSLTRPAAVQICWTKRKCLHRKRVELTQDRFGRTTRQRECKNQFCQIIPKSGCILIKKPRTFENSSSPRYN